MLLGILNFPDILLWKARSRSILIASNPDDNRRRVQQWYLAHSERLAISLLKFLLLNSQ